MINLDRSHNIIVILLYLAAIASDTISIESTPDFQSVISSIEKHDLVTRRPRGMLAVAIDPLH